jgi:hypothetical protein
MPLKRSISTGLGALTPSAWNEIVEAVDYYQSLGNVVNAVNGAGETNQRTILALIGAATQIGTAARWEYAWTQVRRSASATTYAADGGLSNATPGMRKALNLLEVGNTDALAYGISVSGLVLNNADGWEFKPVPAGAVVQLRMVRDIGGVLSLEFIAPNPIDGACPVAPSPILGTDFGTFPDPDEFAVLDFGSFLVPTEYIDFGTFI